MPSKQLANASGLPIERRWPLKHVRSRTTQSLIQARTRATEGIGQETEVHRIRSLKQAPGTAVLIAEFLGDSQEELF
jgi:hypothetical protein